MITIILADAMLIIIRRPSRGGVSEIPKGCFLCSYHAFPSLYLTRFESDVFKRLVPPPATSDPLSLPLLTQPPHSSPSSPPSPPCPRPQRLTPYTPNACPNFPPLPSLHALHSSHLLPPPRSAIAPGLSCFALPPPLSPPYTLNPKSILSPPPPATSDPRASKPLLLPPPSLPHSTP